MNNPLHRLRDTHRARARFFFRAMMLSTLVLLASIPFGAVSLLPCFVCGGFAFLFAHHQFMFQGIQLSIDATAHEEDLRRRLDDLDGRANLARESA